MAKEQEELMDLPFFVEHVLASMDDFQKFCEEHGEFPESMPLSEWTAELGAYLEGEVAQVPLPYTLDTEGPKMGHLVAGRGDWDRET